MRRTCAYMPLSERSHAVSFAELSQSPQCTSTSPGGIFAGGIASNSLWVSAMITRRSGLRLTAGGSVRARFAGADAALAESPGALAEAAAALAASG